MKNLLFLSLISFYLVSCTSKLTESKVKELVKDCMDKTPVETQTGYIQTGKVPSDNYNIPQYKELEKKGLLKMEYKEEKNSYDDMKVDNYNEYMEMKPDSYDGIERFYLISLTEESKPFIIESDKDSYTVRLYTYTLDKVGSIFIHTDNSNKAEVSITYKKVDKTPFCEILDPVKGDFKTVKIELFKTENKGWIYCK